MAKDYNAHIQEVVTRASAMQKTLVDPFRTDDGSFLIPQNRQEAEKRNQILESAIKDSIFEMADTPHNLSMIRTIFSSPPLH